MQDNVKILDTESLVATLQKKTEQGQRVVTTNGCFDLLHVGHLRYLKAAKKIGDILVVLVNGDISIKALKGDSRPVISAGDRAEMVAGLACVDYVTLFDEDTPAELLKQIRPHVHVKGGDYDQDNLPEAPLLKQMGTQLVFVPVEKGYSTSSIIDRILQTATVTSHHAAS